MDFLNVYSVVTLVVAMVFGVLLPATVVSAYSRFEFGAVLIALAFAVESITMEDPALDFGLKIYYPDAFLVIVAMAALIRQLTPCDRPNINVSCLVLGCVFLFSTISGLLSFGTAAGVDARPYFYLLAAGLYGMSFRIDTKKTNTVLKLMSFTALFLIGLTFYRWLYLYTFVGELFPPAGTDKLDGSMRVVHSHQALLIAQLSLLLVYYANISKYLIRLYSLAPVFISIALLLQHRSVWLAAIIGFFTRFFMGKQKDDAQSGKYKVLYIIIALFLLLVISQLFDQKQGITDQVKSSATTALAGEGTVAERLASWQELLKIWTDAGPRSIFIGQSFGSDNTRYVKNEIGIFIKINYTAHNFYVQTLFNLGILGLLAYFAIINYTLRGLWKIRKNPSKNQHAEAFIILIIMQLVYYVPYGADYYQGFLLGICLAYTKSNQQISKSQ
jgi:O-antigen ligase